MTIQIEAPELTAAIKELIQAISQGPSQTIETPVVETLEPEQTPDKPATTPTGDETEDAPPLEELIKTVTIEEVRAVLTQLTRSGRQAEAKALLSETGHAKLTEVPSDQYAALLEAAQQKLGESI